MKLIYLKRFLVLAALSSVPTYLYASLTFLWTTEGFNRADEIGHVPFAQKIAITSLALQALIAVTYAYRTELLRSIRRSATVCLMAVIYILPLLIMIVATDRAYARRDVLFYQSVDIYALSMFVGQVCIGLCWLALLAKRS